MKHNSGMTIPEIILIIVVLGVIGAITAPKFRTMLYQSREARTKSHLGDIRGAIAIYYSDNFGLYPSDEGTPETRLSETLVPQYMKSFPKVDLAHHHFKHLNTVQERVDDQGDWVYTTYRGFVAINCTHLDTRGNPISSW